MSKHRRGDVYDAVYGARMARRRFWLYRQSTGIFIDSVIARLRASEGFDQWETDGGGGGEWRRSTGQRFDATAGPSGAVEEAVSCNEHDDCAAAPRNGFDHRAARDRYLQALRNKFRD